MVIMNVYIVIYFIYSNGVMLSTNLDTAKKEKKRAKKAVSLKEIEIIVVIVYGETKIIR